MKKTKILLFIIISFGLYSCNIDHVKGAFSPSFGFTVLFVAIIILFIYRSQKSLEHENEAKQSYYKITGKRLKL